MRNLVVGAAQLGPIARDEPRSKVVARLIALLQEAASVGCELVVYPELALTTFFPRWYLDETPDELDAYFETSMPNDATQPLFDEARRLGVGFCLGYAERTPDGHRFNSYILVGRDGSTVARYRKVHIPGHEEHEPWRLFQHLERRYFEESPEGFAVHGCFGGVMGMALCNDRRWPETYRVMGLQGVELIMIGYNTPLHYAPDPAQNPLAAFHNHLVMQAGAYQNGTWVVGVAKGGIEEGVESLAQSVIIAPSGQIVAQAVTTGDELISARCDLDWCRTYKETLFDFARYRRPEAYGAINEPSAARIPRDMAEFDRNTDEREAEEGDANVVEFRLNGQAVEARDDHPHLLAALREELGITSAKDGCSPTGQCGCCTVLVGGKARVSCQTPMAKVEGIEITTLEGFDDDEVRRMADAFAVCGALQCGFCTPGIVVRTKALIDKKGAALTREEASRHLGAHLCRCTGYIKVLDAVEALAHDEVPVAVSPQGVGTSGIKYEGRELSVGTRDFIDDMNPDGCLHGALRLADHARADVLVIRTDDARAVDGVHAVYTATDIPGERRVGIIHKDWPVMIPAGGRTSYLGDVLAVVVADDRETARRAAALVEVDYEVLAPMVDPVRVIDSDDDAVWELSGNILSRSAYARGDVDGALERSAYRVDEMFQTQRVEHAFLEPESTLAVPTRDDGERGLYVYSGGQGIWDDRDDIARLLGVDDEIVTTELVSNGGAFGGKEDMSNQAHTALAAWLLDRPVKITLSREESLLMHPKRHPIRMHYQAGCDDDGRLTAVRARMIGDSGPYASVGMKVLERAAGHATGPYLLDHVDVESVAVRTNNSVCGAFRGFGANQAQFAMEGVLDRLAEQVGISGWEIRSRNVVAPGGVWGPGQIMDEGCLGARACLDAVKPAYDAAMAAGQPVGVGLGLKNSGLGNGFKEVAKAVVRLHADGVVEVRHCWTEMGQGVHTVAQQVAVEELRVEPERVRVIVDTTRELGAGQTTGSRGTLMGAGSVADACRVALADGCQIGVDYEGEYRIDWTNSLSEGLDHPVIHSTFGYAAQVVVLDAESGDVDYVVAAHDVGRAVNPLLCEGQIEGAVHMGLGYALTEGFPCDEDGRPLNDTLRSLDIIRPKDMPPVDVILVEAPQPGAPYGIKGVGEIGLVPTAGAVAAAIREHSGEWHAELPMRNMANRERATAWT